MLLGLRPNLQDFVPDHVPRWGRELGLEVVLEAGEDGGSNLEEQGQVRHGQLDVGVSGMWKEGTLKNQPLESSDADTSDVCPT